MDATRQAIRRMLTEAADAPVPRYFYLALDFGTYAPLRERTLSGLLAGRLEGVRGIGGTSIQDMIMDWGTLRDLLIRMPGDDVASLNDISLIRYDDPAYLMANNMEVLGRLFNSPGDPQQILTKMGSHVIQALKKSGAGQQAYEFQYSVPLQTFGHWVRKIDFQINSVDDMVQGFFKYLDDSSKSDDYHIRDRALRLDYDQPDFPDPSEWRKWFHQGVKNMGALYSAEVEWGVKADALVIPESSNFWAISPDPQYMKAYREWKRTGKLPVFGMGWEEIVAEVDAWYNDVLQLRAKYTNVQVVSQQRAKKEREKLFTRRERQRQAGD